MKKSFATLIASVIVTTATAVQAAETQNFSVSVHDATGSELLYRWAQQEGKLTRWHAGDLFKITPAIADYLNACLTRSRPQNLQDAVSVFIHRASDLQLARGQSPFKACVFGKGDIKAAVFDAGHPDCTLTQ